MKNLYGLILAGGSGTRLWPISRDYYPKQFLKIYGGKTLIQHTFERLKKVTDPKNIYITTNRAFIDEVVDQLKELGLSTNNIIIQPTDKNTAPAIAQASKLIFDKDNSAIVITCPSDHIIQPESNFVNSVRDGYKLAKKDFLVTFGIKPKSPNTEYGYIMSQKSQSLKLDFSTSYKVKGFVEKPNIYNARKLIKEGSYWNSGIFIWKAEMILKEIEKFSKNIFDASSSNKGYFAIESVSIDNCVLEKSNLVWVIPVDFEWQDLGSWKALYELLPKDKGQNVVNNQAISYHCNSCLIYGSDNRTVVALNLKDIVIVDTEDCVFVASRNQVNEIKNLVKLQTINGLSRSIQKPLVTIITPTLNNEKYIENTLQSVSDQKYKNIEHIVVDGGSTDHTLKFIDKYRYKLSEFLTIPNSSDFEKINKGIEHANGQIIGILTPGNSYVDSKTIGDTVEAMEKEKADVLWGDLVYFNHENDDKVAMYWKSSNYKKGLMQRGWTLPHPTFFVRKNIYDKYGSFNTKYHVSAEYELILRLLEKYQVKGIYIPQVLVKMVGKGLNLKNIMDRLIGNFESYRSWEENNLEVSPLILFSKNISKLPQFWKKKDLRSNI